MTDERTRKDTRAPGIGEPPTVKITRPAARDAPTVPFAAVVVAAEGFGESTQPADDGPTTIEGGAIKSLVQCAARLHRERDALLALAATIERGKGGDPAADAALLRRVVALIEQLVHVDVD